jgi:hypothetical protein
MLVFLILTLILVYSETSAECVEHANVWHGGIALYKSNNLSGTGDNCLYEKCVLAEK